MLRFCLTHPTRTIPDRGSEIGSDGVSFICLFDHCSALVSSVLCMEACQEAKRTGALTSTLPRARTAASLVGRISASGRARTSSGRTHAEDVLRRDVVR